MTFLQVLQKFWNAVDSTNNFYVFIIVLAICKPESSVQYLRIISIMWKKRSNYFSEAELRYYYIAGGINMQNSGFFRPIALSPVLKFSQPAYIFISLFWRVTYGCFRHTKMLNPFVIIGHKVVWLWIDHCLFFATLATFCFEQFLDFWCLRRLT